MRQRTLVLGIALGAAATLIISTAAFADTLTVTFGDPTGYTLSPPTLTGPETSSLSEHPGTTYTGSYAASGTLNLVSWPVAVCIVNPTLSLNNGGSDVTIVAAPNGTTPTTVCWGTSSTPSFGFSIVPSSGTGVFQGASGGGTVTFNSSTDSGVYTTQSPGSFDPPTAGSTPELDSLALFGAGALGLAGYALTWRRSRRKPSA